MLFHTQPNRIFAEDISGKLLAEITFPEIDSGVCTIQHTFVDDSLRGQGIASQLVQMAVKQIIQQGKNVSATCSYALHWLDKHSAKSLTILQIFDEDYGCEGVPDGQEPMCRVLVENENHSETWLRIPDCYLTQNAIREGDSLELFFAVCT